MARRAIELAMVAAVCASGCLSFDDVQCADGHLCPPGSRCDDIHGGCILPSQLQACAGISDGDDCEIDGAGGTCVNGGCVAWFCGDGARNGGEACEGTDFGGMTCVDFGFTNPDGLTCSEGCRINKDDCTGGCGDNVRDETELCDGDDIGDQTCKKLGFYDEPGLACSGFCTFDISKCTGYCGDGMTNGPEQCDSVPNTNQSCLDYSFDAGRLGCTLCSPGFEGCTSFGWKRVATPTAQRLRGIWGTASDDFYVVGIGGTILHYDGSQFATVASPTTNDLFSIWGSSPTNIFAVGGGGRIVHYDGTWSSTTHGSAFLLGVWGASANDVYAVGGAGTVLHYDGTWAAVSGTGVGANDLRAVWGTGGHVFIVGANGTAAHYDGNTWTTTSVGTSIDLYALWGSSSSNVFASGTDAVGRATIYRYNGATWGAVSSTTDSANTRYAGLWGSGANDAFAVGTTLLHYDGSKWSPLLVASDVQALTATKLYAVWGSPTGDVWTAGEEGYVGRWGGASWTTTSMSPATTASLRGVSSIGTSDALTVGLGVTGRYDGVTWTMQNTSSASDALHGVWAATSSFAVAVGDNSASGIFYHWNGSNWTKVLSGDTTNCSALPGLPSAPLRAVWGSSESNIYAVGGSTSGTFKRFDGSCWSTPSAQPSSSAQMFGVFGPSSSTSAFATNTAGAAFAFDGANWTTMPAPPANAFLGATWSSSANDVFAVGDAIVHWDGTKWSRMSGNGQFLGALSGTGPRNVFAAGDKGRLLHYDGISWTPIRVPVSGTTFLRGLSATARSLVVVGDNGFVQRLAFSQRPSEVNCRDAWDDDGDGMPDCADSECAADAYCTRGGACPVVTDVKCGEPISGSTVGRTPGRDYYTCDANAETGPEAIYRIVPTTSGSATATLSAFAPAELDLVVVGSMAATDACDPDAACRGASSTDATATEVVTFTTTAGKPQYIIVEGRNTAAGPFTLEVTCQ